MSRKRLLLITIVITLLLISTTAGCGTPAVTTRAQFSSAVEAITTVPATTTDEAAKPRGELVAALQGFGNENFIPWKANNDATYANLLVYDTLLYYDAINRKFLPGLTESWEVSLDAMTTTFYLRKGVQYSDGWGEFTSDDVKFNFEKQGGADSTGLIAVRKIKSMETPDPYTLVCHFKLPQPTFYSLFSLGNSGACQGFVSKKYYETVGEKVASQKPIGTGPYKLVELQSGSYVKLEAKDSHWRVVPEFRTLTLRALPETSTLIAALKNKEIDLASVPAEQLADLKATGLATEVSPFGGGGIIGIAWGGIAIPEDDRYDPDYHNKDPRVDSRVRKAMTIAIDRESICKTIFAGGATPAGVPLYSADMGEYQYPYDPAAARQLLKDAGYPDGFSFKAISFVQQGVPETPRLMETLVAYWQQIGLDPKIVMTDDAAYSTTHRASLKTAGEVYFSRIVPVADMLDKASIHLMPGCMALHYMDEGSYAIWKEGSVKVNSAERETYVEKLNKYYFENLGPIPVIISGSNWVWNSTKISPFPYPPGETPRYLEYVRHAEPLNTFRLFTPMPGR
jgi:peptide/nickel transport system substrate-binding protein